MIQALTLANKCALALIRKLTHIACVLLVLQVQSRKVEMTWKNIKRKFFIPCGETLHIVRERICEKVKGMWNFVKGKVMKKFMPAKYNANLEQCNNNENLTGSGIPMGSSAIECVTESATECAAASDEVSLL